jgi:hypothetical protein
LVALLSLPLGYYFFIVDWQGRPYCHRQIEGALQQWMLEVGKTNTFPNIGGLSRDSLAVAGQFMGGPLDWADNYNYVPGLRDSDPPDLVLMYINRPTRWNWHGQHPTIFKKKAETREIPGLSSAATDALATCLVAQRHLQEPEPAAANPASCERRSRFQMSRCRAVGLPNTNVRVMSD